MQLMKSFINNLLSVSQAKRFVFFLICDTVLIVFSLFLSFLFHLDFDINAIYFGLILEVLPFFLGIKLISFAVFRVYRITWRYVGIADLVNIVIALVVAAMVLIVLSLPNSLLSVKLAITGFPKRIILEDCIISVLLITGLRVLKRVYLEILRKRQPSIGSKRTIIVGAGNTGEMIVRDMIRQRFDKFYPIGFLDDEAAKAGTLIHGVPVIGGTEKLRGVTARNRVEALIIAIPRLEHKMLKRLYDDAKKAHIETVKIVPRIYNFDNPDVRLKGLEDIRIEDLLGRQPVIADTNEIGRFLGNRSVLITGAGGSIGAEITSQVCAFQPKRVVALDIDETELHNLSLKLRRLFPELTNRVFYRTGDVRDEMRLNEVFQEFKPEIVFHAAAYKHVPMMEYNPKEAIKVNILGTYRLANTARQHGAVKFVMISTDKAVRPTSIMGATKRMAEYVCRAFNENNIQRSDNESTNQPINQSTRFISVRFGNVLGSRGSVLPLFLDQLKHGGPLTVTHRDMKRYFMTIPEAVSLVLQASTMGEGGEVFVLDMGEPANIAGLAEDLIRIHGMEPYKDIDIEFTGLRPGEKLFEEILTAEEGTIASKHEKVFVAKNSEKYSLLEIDQILGEFKELIQEPSFDNGHRVKELLKKYVKHYEEN